MVYIFPLVQGFNFLNGKHSQTHHLLLESEQFNEEDQILSVSLIPWCPLHFLGYCCLQVIQGFLCSTSDKSHTHTHQCAHSLCSHLALAFANLSAKLPSEAVLVSLCPSSSGQFFPSFGTTIRDISHSTFPTQCWCKSGSICVFEMKFWLCHSCREIVPQTCPFCTVQLVWQLSGEIRNPVGHSSIEGNVWLGGIRKTKLREQLISHPEPN